MRILIATIYHGLIFYSITYAPKNKKMKTQEQKQVQFRPLPRFLSANRSSKESDPLYECRNLQVIANLCALLEEVAEGRGWLGCLQARGKPGRFDLMAVRRDPRTLERKNSVTLKDIIDTSQASTGTTELKTYCIS